VQGAPSRIAPPSSLELSVPGGPLVELEDAPLSSTLAVVSPGAPVVVPGSVLAVPGSAVDSTPLSDDDDPLVEVAEPAVTVVVVPPSPVFAVAASVPKPAAGSNTSTLHPTTQHANAHAIAPAAGSRPNGCMVGGEARPGRRMRRMGRSEGVGRSVGGL
jgi:hypothetical protein